MRPARWRSRTASSSTRAAGASCSSTTARISARASEPRPACSSRGRGKQVICLTGDGSFLFGPTALWNMARLELPVTVVVYNNHAYSGPHNRALANLGGGGRSIDANKFVHDYLGKPDMDMAAIAKGFGVDGERAKTPAELKAALGRARRNDGRREAVSDRRRSRAPRSGLDRRSLGADARLIPPSRADDTMSRGAAMTRVPGPPANFLGT